MSSHLFTFAEKKFKTTFEFSYCNGAKIYYMPDSGVMKIRADLALIFTRMEIEVISKIDEGVLSLVQIVYSELKENIKLLDEICYPFSRSNDLDFVLEDETQSLWLFGINDAVSAAIPMIEESFYYLTMKRSMAVYLKIFPSILRNSVDPQYIFFSENTLHIHQSVAFQQCQQILESVLIVQKHHVCTLFPNFSSDLIRSYLRYFVEEKITVAMVFLSNDGKIVKKYAMSKIPHLCGDRQVVGIVSEVFMYPIECRVTLTRLGFVKLNANRIFTCLNEKCCHVSSKTYPDFVSISGFIKNDIKQFERRLYHFLGVDAVSSVYVASSKDVPRIKINVPIDWTIRDNTDATFLDEILPESCEWDDISRTFSVSRCTVLRLQRVENRHQWFKFTQTRERFIALEHDPNEIIAYHGTGNVDPSLIYVGAEGLDFRLSDEGFWGRGNYFAKGVSMANRFSYKVPKSNFRQIIIFKILAGKMIQLDMDKSLTIPPFVPDELASYKNERYNTVTGLHPWGTVFVLYTNQGIYPQYIVTYAYSN